MSGETYRHLNLFSLDVLLESSPDSVIVFDETGLIWDANHTAQALFSYHRDELIGNGIALLLPGIDALISDNLPDKLFNTPSGNILQLSENIFGMDRNGREIPLSMYLLAVKQGERILFFSNLRKPGAGGTVVVSRPQIHSSPIFTALPHGVLLLDLDQRILHCNPAFRQLLQLENEDLSQLALRQFCVEGEGDKDTELFNALLRGERESLQMIRELRRRDGETVLCRINISLLDKDSGPALALALVENITRQEMIRRELEKTHHILEKRLQDRTNALKVANRNLQMATGQYKRMEKALGESRNRLRLLVNNMPIIMFTADRNGTIGWVEGKGLENLQLSPETLRGNTPDQIFPDSSCLLSGIHSALEGQQVASTVSVGDRVMDLWCAPIHNKTDKQVGVIGIMTDITERIRAQQKISASEKDLSAILNNMQDTFYRTDNNGDLTMVSPSVAKLLGYTQDEVLGMNISDLYLDPNGSRQFMALLKQNNGRIYNYETPLRRKDGSILWVSSNAHWRVDQDGNVLGTEGTARDITKSKRTEQRLYYLANYDSLTELPNRTLFRDRLRHAMALARRNRKKIALFFLDIDHFKSINDSLGHLAGDQLLQAVARRIRSCAREGDTVARMGGDEFTVILEGIQSHQDAEQVAGKIIETMSSPIQLEDHNIYVSPSIGISLYPDDSENIDEMIRCADTAMYQAKDQGRNNYQFFTRDMKYAAIESLLLQNNLRTALDRNQLMLYYQPQLDLQSGLMVGMEALIRWLHPEHGFLQPADFIPLAEESGLITYIDDWVLENVCTQINIWKDLGLPLVNVAVNLSSLQFQQRDFVDKVKSILNTTRIDPSLLEFEITEGILINDVEQAAITLRQLGDLGIRLCIDDFGMGYSSLSYLRQFPLHALKIDRSFIRDVDNGHRDSAITEAIIAMGHSLDLEVVAEGVEREEQLSFLVPKGCDRVQGYLFSGPCSATDIAEWMGQQVLAE